MGSMTFLRVPLSEEWNFKVWLCGAIETFDSAAGSMGPVSVNRWGVNENLEFHVFYIYKRVEEFFLWEGPFSWLLWKKVFSEIALSHKVLARTIVIKCCAYLYSIKWHKWRIKTSTSEKFRDVTWQFVFCTCMSIYPKHIHITVRAHFSELEIGFDTAANWKIPVVNGLKGKNPSFMSREFFKWCPILGFL
jgi:hypothetical protein